MKLADLSKPQWDAAQHAARCLAQGNPNDADDRATYRASVAALVAVLPGDVDAKAIIAAATRWQMLNDIAGAFAGLPTESIAA